MDRLEVVDVEDREGRVEEAVAELLERFHQRDAVAEAGERIAQRAIGDGGLGLLARGDVGDQSQTAADALASPIIVARSSNQG